MFHQDEPEGVCGRLALIVPCSVLRARLRTTKDAALPQCIEPDPITCRQDILQPGELLTLYTDGVSELRDKANNELGYDGLLAMVQKLPLDDSTATGTALLSAIETYSNSALDDLTLLVLNT